MREIRQSGVIKRREDIYLAERRIYTVSPNTYLPFVAERWLPVLAQDWPADESIVGNDGSTDRDDDELSRLAGNIRVVNQSNRGVSAARNRGCELATSEYIAIIDADDAWLPGKLRSSNDASSYFPAQK